MTFDQSKNIRQIIGLDDTDLRASLEKSGWIPQFPAYADENGVLIIGHRRMKLAEELGIKPVVETIRFGNGSEGDAKRLELAIASNIGAGLSKKDRESIAVRAYEHGYTMEQIAKLLGVVKSTVSKDLSRSEIVSDGNNSKPAKTATNPKGAGRPRTKKLDVAPKRSDHAPRVIGLHDSGATIPEIAQQTGVGKRQVRHIVEREKIEREVAPVISVADLSLTAQQKLDGAINQEKKKLEQRFEARVAAEVDQRVRTYMEAMSEELAKEREEHKRVMNARDGFMTKETYRNIRNCLHPDRAMHPERFTDPKLQALYNHAFHEFSKLEKCILNEKESPTLSSPLPRTRAEWEERRRKVTEERKAKAAARKNQPGSVTKAK